MRVGRHSQAGRCWGRRRARSRVAIGVVYGSAGVEGGEGVVGVDARSALAVRAPPHV